MLSKRVIPCLDVRAGRLTKGIKFQGNVDIGDPVESARRYYEEGADEIVFYDITASAEERGIFLDVVERVASQIFIPFSVGGGISSVADMRAVLNAGAEKVSINSAAVRNPDLVADGAAAFGSQAIVVGMDVLRVPVSESIPSGYEIVIQGGRRRMGIDAIEWARQCQELGAGEFERAVDTNRKMIAFGAVLCMGAGTLLAIFAPLFPRIYNTTDYVRELARNLLWIDAIFLTARGLYNSCYFTLRSGGKTLLTFLFDSVSMWLLNLPTAFILAHFTGLPLISLYVVVQIVDAMKTLLGLYLVKKGIWINNLT